MLTAMTPIAKPPILARIAFLIVAAISLAGCVSTFDNHGYVPPEDELAQIEVGRDTRETVAEAVGRPSTSGVVRDEAWFYTAYRIENYAFRAPTVVERDVLAISFNERGVVSNIERFGLEDGRIVTLSRRVTETSVRDNGLLRQIMTNFGRFNVADVIN